MAQLIADRRDVDFVLHEQFRAETLCRYERYRDFDRRTFDLIVDEARNLAIKEILPTLAAVRLGRRILLANKEALVVAGALFMQAARESGATVLPIDSEHNAIFQCLEGLTAYDGLTRADLQRVATTYLAPMPLVEVVHAENTNADEIAKGAAVCNQIGRFPLPVKLMKNIHHFGFRF